MSKLDKVTFMEISCSPNNVRWLCGSKDESVDAIGIGRSKFAAYRDYEVQLGGSS